MTDRKYRSGSWLRRQYVDRGRSTSDIGRQCGVDQVTILNWLKRFGIETRSTSGHPDDAKWKDEEWVREQYVELERPATEIADELGISSQTFYYWMDEHGVEREATRYGHKSRVEYATYYLDDQGYPRWQSKHQADDGRVTRNFHVHRLLAIAVYGIEAVEGKVVHHRNGIPWDNRPENIELLEPGEHSSKHRRAESEGVPVEVVG